MAAHPVRQEPPAPPEHLPAERALSPYQVCTLRAVYDGLPHNTRVLADLWHVSPGTIDAWARELGWGTRPQRRTAVARLSAPRLTKQCSACGRTLPAWFFQRSENTADGLYPCCADCM